MPSGSQTGLDTILGANMRNKKSWKSVAAPDTDSNFIQLAGQGNNVTPDLEFSHNFVSYIAPTGNSQDVYINGPVRWEDRSLIVFRLDNSNNTVNKEFTFSSSYDMLDNPGVLVYTLTPGQVRVWYGAIFNGRVCLRESVDTSL